MPFSEQTKAPMQTALPEHTHQPRSPPA